VEGLEVAAAEEAASGRGAARGTDGRRESQGDGCPLPASILIIQFFKLTIKIFTALKETSVVFFIDFKRTKQ
jgi:hypothetical protein